MRLPPDITIPEQVDRDRMSRLEERIARIEEHLGLEKPPIRTPAIDSPAGLAPVFGDREQTENGFEVELGQHWFALAGVAILTAGVAFLLSLPHKGLPAALPPIAGFV